MWIQPKNLKLKFILLLNLLNKYYFKNTVFNIGLFKYACISTFQRDTLLYSESISVENRI